MIFVYDILINLNDKLFDFYDWNKNDNILHVKKIPVFRVKSNDLINIKKCICNFKQEFVDKIYKKTEFFKYNSGRIYNYVCILSDCKEAVVVSLCSDGILKLKSGLLLSDEIEVINLCKNLDLCNVLLTVINDSNDFCFKTRKEVDIELYIKNELKTINGDKLKYLYFECFNEVNNDRKKMLSRLLFELDNNFYSIYSKIHSFLILTSTNK